MKKFHLLKGFTLIELLVVITIIGILAGLAIPATMSVVKKANQMKSMANARQIYIGLMGYANDHDSIFPNVIATATESGTSPLANANDAYANLIPQYVPQEKVFYIAASKWCKSTPPDEKTTDISDRLSRGENAYAYVKNLTATSNPNFPIIAEGFTTGGAATGTYTTDEAVPGGVWGGKAAVVVRVDGSAAVERCVVSGSNYNVMGATGGTAKANIFVPATDWLSSTGQQEAINPLAP